MNLTHKLLFHYKNHPFVLHSLHLDNKFPLEAHQHLSSPHQLYHNYSSEFLFLPLLALQKKNGEILKMLQILLEYEVSDDHLTLPLFVQAAVNRHHEKGADFPLQMWNQDYQNCLPSPEDYLTSKILVNLQAIYFQNSDYFVFALQEQPV